jgi:Ca-activated chloride channel family protein
MRAMRTLTSFCHPGLLLACVAASAVSACATIVPLPITPHLNQLTPEQVFAKGPPPEWHEPTRDDPAQAAVDVACGVGPRLREGTLYAAVSVRGRPPRAAIAPLNVALVLDRSGSMHGQPFANMLQAAEAFVGQFRDGDRVSVVVFSDGVFEAVPPIQLGPATRAPAVAAIRALADGGGTNISGGLLAGLFEVFSFFAEWQVNQVVLFSDGQPNIGITDPHRLADLAAGAAERGVAVTTIGFGLEHDELVMQTLADAGGGSYYYVDTPGDIPTIFQREATGMLRMAARDTVVQVALPAGLIVDDVIGYDYFLGGGRLWIRMGAVPHDEERYVVMRLRADGGGTSALPVAFAYSDMARRGKFGVNCQPGFRIDAGGRDPWVLELAGRAEAAWGLAEAMGWADGGSEVFAISQIAHTRGTLASIRAQLGAGALAQEDSMLEGAQARLGFNVATDAADAGLSGGLSGLLSFGRRTALNTASAAVTSKVDAAFRPLVRAAVQTSWYGQPVGFYSARTQRPYKMHKGDRNRAYKRARFESYVMMRVRVGR